LFAFQKEFAGNTDRSTVVYHDIVPPIFAQMVRIHPKAWNGHISLRAEFYGCTSGMTNHVYLHIDYKYSLANEGRMICAFYM